MTKDTTAGKETPGAPWTVERVEALGVTTSLTVAGDILGIGRAKSYTLAAAGTFPVPVLRVGRAYRVPVMPLLRLLHIGNTPFGHDGRGKTGGLDEIPTHEHQ